MFLTQQKRLSHIRIVHHYMIHLVSSVYIAIALYLATTIRGYGSPDVNVNIITIPVIIGNCNHNIIMIITKLILRLHFFSNQVTK